MAQQLTIVKSESLETPQALTVVKSEPLPAEAPRAEGLASIGEHLKAKAKDFGGLLYSAYVDPVIGVAQGAGRTAVSLGRLVHRIPGVSEAVGDIPDDAETRLGLDAATPGQRVGQFVEGMAEYAIPGMAAERAAVATAGRLAPYLGRAAGAAQVGLRSAAGAGVAAGVAGARGEDASTAAGLAAAVPVVGAAAVPVARALEGASVRLVQAAVKPTVTALRRITGKPGEGLDAKARGLVQFIIDHRLTTAAKAHDLLVESERELQKVLSAKNAPTDAATRAARYLSALERSAAKQGLPVDDVITIRNAAAELLEGPMGQDVVTLIPTPHPTLVQPNGQPFTVLMPKVTRELRPDVPATEALSSARASSRFATNKQWGEVKGTAVEATKAVERAQRDAVKAAVPEAQPILATESKAIQARDVLERMGARQSNRDAVSMPGGITTAVEVASGRLPILGVATQWLRDNQMKAGIWADRMAKAIEAQDVQEVSAILARFGVGAAVPSRP